MNVIWCIINFIYSVWSAGRNSETWVERPGFLLELGHLLQDKSLYFFVLSFLICKMAKLILCPTVHRVVVNRNKMDACQTCCKWLVKRAWRSPGSPQSARGALDFEGSADVQIERNVGRGLWGEGMGKEGSIFLRCQNPSLATSPLQLRLAQLK